MALFPWAAAASKVLARQVARSTASKTGLVSGIKRSSLFLANESRFTARAVLNSNFNPHLPLSRLQAQQWASYGTAQTVSHNGIELPIVTGNDEQRLTLQMAAHIKGKESGCEDAYFLKPACKTFGIADGVGGWALSGVDAGEWSRAYCNHATDVLDEGEVNDTVPVPYDLVGEAYARMDPNMKGSATVLVGQLQGERLTVAWIGDSSLVVIRDHAVKYRTTPQQSGFNAPAQLGYASYTQPSDAVIAMVPVQAGDVIIAATDGLFDNLFTREITELVGDHEDEFDPGMVAEQLVTLAEIRSKDQVSDTPFAIEARLAGYPYFGGKPDDITVVVARVDPEPGQNK